MPFGRGRITSYDDDNDMLTMDDGPSTGFILVMCFSSVLQNSFAAG